MFNVKLCLVALVHSPSHTSPFQLIQYFCILDLDSFLNVNKNKIILQIKLTIPFTDIELSSTS